MKLFKQITCAVLTLCLCAGLLLIPSAPVSAATGPSAPKAVVGLSTLFQTNFFRLFFRYCTGV